jgi:predicted nuclease with TOPRIM domain
MGSVFSKTDEITELKAKLTRYQNEEELLVSEFKNLIRDYNALEKNYTTLEKDYINIKIVYDIMKPKFYIYQKIISKKKQNEYTTECSECKVYNTLQTIHEIDE